MLRCNMNATMSVDQLWGKYRRLQGELSAARSGPQENPARAARLAEEIAGLQHEIRRRVATGPAVPVGVSLEDQAQRTSS
jgi:hypothetical protein